MLATQLNYLLPKQKAGFFRYLFQHATRNQIMEDKREE